MAARGMAAMCTTVRNFTRRKVLHRDPVWARSRLQQAVGLMFRRPEGECLVFVFAPARKDALHMWFVHAPIDIVVLDAMGGAIALKERLRPWGSWNPHVVCSTVIELPAGALPAPGRSEGVWRWHHYLRFLLFNVASALLVMLLILLALRLAGLRAF